MLLIFFNLKHFLFQIKPEKMIKYLRNKFKQNIFQ